MRLDVSMDFYEEKARFHIFHLALQSRVLVPNFFMQIPDPDSTYSTMRILDMDPDIEKI